MHQRSINVHSVFRRIYKLFGRKQYITCSRKPIPTVYDFQKAGWEGQYQEEEADTALVSRKHHYRHDKTRKMMMSRPSTASFASDAACGEFLASAPSVFRDMTPDMWRWIMLRSSRDLRHNLHQRSETLGQQSGLCAILPWAPRLSSTSASVSRTPALSVMWTASVLDVST